MKDSSIAVKLDEQNEQGNDKISQVY